MSFRELLILMVIILVLNVTGFWPRIIRGLRELRGERFDNAPENTADLELCYKLLGISPSSSWNEIERAYRAKAKIHHPDRGGDDDAMRALNDAYAKLKQARRK